MRRKKTCECAVEPNVSLHHRVQVLARRSQLTLCSRKHHWPQRRDEERGKMESEARWAGLRNGGRSRAFVSERRARRWNHAPTHSLGSKRASSSEKELRQDETVQLARLSRARGRRRWMMTCARGRACQRGSARQRCVVRSTHESLMPKKLLRSPFLPMFRRFVGFFSGAT